MRVSNLWVSRKSRIRAAIIHNAVIALGGSDQARVLRRVGEALQIILCIIELLAKQSLALLNDCLLALFITFRKDRTAVGRWLVLPWRQASVALARDGRRMRIDPIEILQNSCDQPLML